MEYLQNKIRYKNLVAMSDDEIAAMSDNYVDSTNNRIDVNFWLDELSRRRMERIARKTLLATWIAAGVAIIALIIALFK